RGLKSPNRRPKNRLPKAAAMIGQLTRFLSAGVFSGVAGGSHAASSAPAVSASATSGGHTISPSSSTWTGSPGGGGTWSGSFNVGDHGSHAGPDGGHHGSSASGLPTLMTSPTSTSPLGFSVNQLLAEQTPGHNDFFGPNPGGQYPSDTPAGDLSQLG